MTDGESKFMTKMAEPKYTSHWTNEISSPLDLERYQDYGSSGSDYMYRAMAVIANALEVLYNIHLRRE